MKKQLSAILLTLALLLTILPVTAWAADSGTCGDNLTWTLDDSGTLTISGTGTMYAYNLTASAPWNSDDIRSVTINSGVTSIGQAAFYGYTNLSSITLSDSISSIGNVAFYECTSLRSITIPNGCTSIGNSAFSGCTSLSSITLPDSVTNIEGSAFYNCTSLSNITIPNSITSIGDNVFGGCTSLTSVTIPSNVTSIGHRAFDGCTSLTSITIPDSVTSIGFGTFRDCNNLTDVYYGGTESQRNEINIDTYNSGNGNDTLINATWHYNSTGPDTTDDTTDDTNNNITIDRKSITLPDGIKCIPYSQMLTENFDHQDGDRYEIAGGDVSAVPPSGLVLNPSTGELRGSVNSTTGVFHFTVRQIRNGQTIAELTCQLTILNNDADTVINSNAYEIEIPIGEPDPENPNSFIKTDYDAEVMKIGCAYEDFKDLYIDGKVKERGVDYTAEPGSIKITIGSQAFKDAGEGQHTIAVECQNSVTGETSTTSQNFTLKTTNTPTTPSTSATPSTPVTPSTPATPTSALPFSDVSASDWYYEALLWAYQEGLIQGIDATHFQGSGAITESAIVIVLARMADIDLSQYDNAWEEGIESGRAFTEAAIWAFRSGLLPDEGGFTGTAATTRNQMAIMLTKYLASMGQNVSAPETLVAFDDANDMTSEGNAAFQVLYAREIFKGTGGLTMSAASSTTRAQFVVLLYRIHNQMS